MTYIHLILLSITIFKDKINMIYLVDVSRGLAGIGIVIAFFLFILAMAFWAKPIQRIFKTGQDMEVITWFSIGLLYAAYNIFIG